MWCVCGVSWTLSPQHVVCVGGSHGPTCGVCGGSHGPCPPNMWCVWGSLVDGEQRRLSGEQRRVMDRVPRIPEGGLNPEAAVSQPLHRPPPLAWTVSPASLRTRCLEYRGHDAFYTRQFEVEIGEGRRFLGRIATISLTFLRNVFHQNK